MSADMTREALKEVLDYYGDGPGPMFLESVKRAYQASAEQPKAKQIGWWISNTTFFRIIPPLLGEERHWKPVYDAPPAPAVPGASAVGQAVSDHFKSLDNGDGTFAFDPCSGDDIDALVDAVLASVLCCLVDNSPIRVPEAESLCRSSCGCRQQEWVYRGASIYLHQDPGLPVQIYVLIDEGEEFELPSATTFDAALAQAKAALDDRYSRAAAGGEKP